MAAYGVIGGIIGGAIAVAIMPFLRKKLMKNNKKKGNKSHVPRSYKPGAAWFGFILAVCGLSMGVYFLCWLINKCNNINILYLFPLFIIFFGILFGCWTGSFIGGKITISNDRLVIEHAAKMPKGNNRHIHFWQLGCHRIDVRWEEIRELRADANQMKIILHNGEVYSFPIGWCKDKARDEVARYKRIKPWE